jgi:cytochrome d ubiquinol oxidase subunit II
MIHTIWFLILALVLVVYAMLDGFDLGAGMLHLVVARTDEDRSAVIDTIGPVWNGNEVWLIAAGGTMVVAFPTLYAASFSGFYLALMLVLWLLILRGLSLEFRHQIDNVLWRHAWDVTFAGSSFLLAFLFGVAIGNVLRGVPLDADGHFQGSFALMLNPFAVLGGILGVVTLALHGAGWIALRATGEVQQRARWWRARLTGAATAAVIGFVADSFAVRPDFTRNFAAAPALLLVPVVGVAGIILLVRSGGRRDVLAFGGSTLLVASILGSAGAGLYPTLLPALPGSAHPGLDIYNAASPETSLWSALGVFAIGGTTVAFYVVKIYRLWLGTRVTY